MELYIDNRSSLMIWRTTRKNKVSPKHQNSQLSHTLFLDKNHVHKISINPKNTLKEYAIFLQRLKVNDITEGPIG
jgi:hypothetical protein